MKRVPCLSLVALLAAGTALSQDASRPSEPTLQTGITQLQEGDFAGAVFTLEAVIRTLAVDPSLHGRELSQAYLHRGAAFVGLGQEEKARASFAAALQYQPDLRITEDRFSPRVVRVFEAARQGKTKSVLLPPSDAKKKAGIGAVGVGLIAGGVALAAGGAAVAASGGNETPTQPSSAVTPMAATRGVLQIDYVSAQPAPGSTVSGHRGTYSFASVLKVRVSVGNPTSTDAKSCNAWVQLQCPGKQCARIVTTSAFDLPHGQTQVVEVGQLDTSATGTQFWSVQDYPTPQEIISMHVSTGCGSGPIFQEVSGIPGYGGRDYSIHYVINP